MKTNKNKGLSYFDSTSLTIIITLDEKPTSQEFEKLVSNHTKVKKVTAIPPKNKKSHAIWLAFPVNENQEQLFYVCFPSTKDNKKCFSIGMSNKGTKEEQMDAAFYLIDNQCKLDNTPFDKLKDIKVPTVSTEELYKTKCAEYPKFSEKVTKAIWEATQGNPCSKCNRPSQCKLRLYTKKEVQNES